MSSSGSIGAPAPAASAAARSFREGAPAPRDREEAEPAPTRRLLLGGVLLLAVVLRAALFVGFVNDYGEENVHLRDALAAKDGAPLAAFDAVGIGPAADGPTDMIALYKFRLLVSVPPGLLMRLLGVGDVRLALWFLLCSLGLVLLTYGLARRLDGEATALVAAGILAVFPFDIVWSSRIGGDLVLSFLFHAALLVLVASSRRGGAERLGASCLAGVLVGLGLFAKIVAVVFLPFAAAVAAARSGRRAAAGVVAGFVLVAAGEGLLYERTAGDPFLHFRTARGGVEKNALEVFPFAPRWRAAGVTYHGYTDSLFFVRLLTGTTGQEERDRYFSLWGWLALAGLVVALARRRWLVPALFVYLWAYFELGLSLVRWEDGGLHLYQIFKEPKYFLLALPSVAILGGMAGAALARWRRFLAAVVLLALAAVSVADARAVSRRLAPALDDVAAAARDLVALAGEAPVYVDPLGTDLYLRLFSGDRIGDIRLLGGRRRLPRGALVLVGGTRGLRPVGERLEAFYREEAPVLVGEPASRAAPPRFERLGVYPPPAGIGASRPLAVYRVVAVADDPPPPPPELELWVETPPAGGPVVLNGRVRAHGEDNEVFLRLDVDGRTVRRGFFFPVRLAVPSRYSVHVRVVATDAYGSRTERRLVVRAP